MSFDWKHLALGIVIGLILGMWGYATYFCKAEVRHDSPVVTIKEEKPDTFIVYQLTQEQKDSVIREFGRRLKIAQKSTAQFYKREIDSILSEIRNSTDTLVATPLTLINDHLQIREYNRMYDFGTACIDVNSLVFQNELAYQKVTYNLTSSGKPTFESPTSPNFEAFTGLHLNNLPSYSSLDLSLTIRYKRNLYSGGWSLNGHGFSLGWERKIF